MGASGSQVGREGQAEGEGKRKGGRERRKRKQQFLKMRRNGQEAGAGQKDLPRPPHTQGSCFGDLEGRERWSGRPVTFLIAAGKYLDCQALQGPGEAFLRAGGSLLPSRGRPEGAGGNAFSRSPLALRAGSATLSHVVLLIAPLEELRGGWDGEEAR